MGKVNNNLIIPEKIPMLNIITRKKSILFYLNITERNRCRLNKYMDITYGFMVKKSKKFEDEGYVISEKVGRTREFKYTKKGKELRDWLLCGVKMFGSHINKQRGK